MDNDTAWIESFIGACKANGIGHAKIEFNGVKVELSFAPQLYSPMLKGPFELATQQENMPSIASNLEMQALGYVAQKDRLDRRTETLAERLERGRKEQADIESRRPPREVMSDIELATSPPDDLREAMEKPLVFDAPVGEPLTDKGDDE